jgi:hypothetical protein
MRSLGNNVKYDVDGDTLTLKIDLSEEGCLSRSGKSRVIASTAGTGYVISDQYHVSVTVYKPK